MTEYRSAKLANDIPTWTTRADSFSLLKRISFPLIARGLISETRCGTMPVVWIVPRRESKSACRSASVKRSFMGCWESDQGECLLGLFGRPLPTRDLSLQPCPPADGLTLSWTPNLVIMGTRACTHTRAYATREQLPSDLYALSALTKAKRRTEESGRSASI